jgi:hypothetical protein
MWRDRRGRFLAALPDESPRTADKGVRIGVERFNLELQLLIVNPKVVAFQ